MSLRTAQAAALLAATVTTGLMAGVFGLYAHAIMRGLGHTDDRTFVRAFQSIDRAIINPLFMLSFFGALLFSGAAVVLQVRGDVRTALPWVVVACGLNLVVVIITMAVHLPLNDAIKAANPGGVAEFATVRHNFHEGRWVAWNVVRVVAITAALGCLTWSLVLHGRSTAVAAATSPTTSSSAGVPLPPPVSALAREPIAR